MEKLTRNDKLYLNDYKTKESYVNEFLSCRDGIVEVYEYSDDSGYGSKTKLFLCKNTKHEVVSIIRWIWCERLKEWIEEEISFDNNSFEFLKTLISGSKNELGGKYTVVRDYSKEG